MIQSSSSSVINFERERVEIFINKKQDADATILTLGVSYMYGFLRGTRESELRTRAVQGMRFGSAPQAVSYVQEEIQCKDVEDQLYVQVAYRAGQINETKMEEEEERRRKEKEEEEKRKREEEKRKKEMEEKRRIEEEKRSGG